MHSARLPFLLAGLALGACAAACGPGSPGACDGIGCSGHGYCVAVADMPYCVCAAGYHPVGAACEQNVVTNPCEGIDCDGHGTCRVEDDAPVCDCATGYQPLGELHCVPTVRPDAGPDDVGADDAGPDEVGLEDVAAEEVAPRCGDGVVQTGEQCDDGNAADDDACRTSCRTAECGDGVVWTGVEECDTTDSPSCTTSCGTDGWLSCIGCNWTGCEAVGDPCNGTDDDCDTVTDEDGCGYGRYCLEGACWDEPTFEQGPACADLGTAHPAPGYLSYYQVRGRPGARVAKWNRHASCAGAVAAEAPETAPPNDVRIDATGIARLEFPLDGPVTVCEHEVLGMWESWVVIDGVESNHVSGTYYDSLCTNVQTCDLGSAYCPP